MSGIYIPIKVPKGCSGCPIDSDCCTLWQQLPPERLGDTRPRGCPIVVVPDHGRLIDADALITKVTDAAIKQPEIADVYYEQASEIGGWLYSMPTIIPADKEA